MSDLIPDSHLFSYATLFDPNKVPKEPYMPIFTQQQIPIPDNSMIYKAIWFGGAKK